MDFEIIDFHTHPFSDNEHNICVHKDIIAMDEAYSKDVLMSMGITKICGSVVERDSEKYENAWDRILENNNEALRLRDLYKGFYIPGFHIHPDFVEESVKEINRMAKEGVKLIGEIVPYMYGWKDYGSEGLSEILNEAGRKNMIVSLHTLPENAEGMEKMVSEHPDVIFVAAHPGEYPTIMMHTDFAKKYENYYIDLSGTGIFRYGALRRLIDSFGIERVLFGSDYPTCNPSTFVGGVLFDKTLTDAEKEKIFSLNTRKLLGTED